MADYDSSLPVRTETNGDVAAKIVDGTIPSQTLTVEADGSINVNDNGGTLTVDAINLDIRDLVFATDKVDVSGSTVALDAPTLAALESITVQNPAGAGAVNIQDGGNSITVDAVDLDIRDLDATQDNVAISDGTDTLEVNVDGSINITDNGGSLTVDAINLDIRDLVFATDKVDVTGSEVSLDAATLAALETITANQGTPNTLANAWSVEITDGTDSVLVTAAGELSVIATAQPGVDIGDVTINNAAGAAAVNIQDGGNSITVDAVNLDIRDLTHVSDSVRVGDGTDFIAVNTDGSINVVISDNSPGTPINDYNTAVAVASGASSNHDYTVTAGEILYLNQIEASGTGKARIAVDVETGVATGVFTRRFVQFNSTANTNMSIHIENPIPVAAGVRVRIIRQNRDLQAQDLYSTISGYELP